MRAAPDGLTVAAPGTDVAEVFTRLGWQVVAPAGKGTFRQVEHRCDPRARPGHPDFSDPAMRADDRARRRMANVRAVREGHAFVAPSLPFGWLEEPPSINRLLGLAWLGGRDPVMLAALFNAVVYGHALTPPQLDTRACRRPVHCNPERSDPCASC